MSSWYTLRYVPLVGALSCVSTETQVPPQNGTNEASAEDQFSTRERGIAHGAASSERAIVSVERERAGGWQLCSGTLIASGLVLTAAHCVTETAKAGSCDQLVLEPKVTPDLLRVSLIPDLSGSPQPEWAFLPVAEVHLIAEADSKQFTSLCGNDLALLVLAELPHEDPAPLPVSSQRVERGDSVVALGYGAGHPAGTGERVRRRSEVIQVQCVGSECANAPLAGWAGGPDTVGTDVSTHEFATAPGPCSGDSGGPALQDGWIVGVLSRGFDDCSSPIFTIPGERVAEVVRGLAESLAFEVPAWARLPRDPPDEETGGDGSTAPLGGAGGDGGAPVDKPSAPQEMPAGCSLARGRGNQYGPSPEPLLTWLPLVALIGWRRAATGVARGKDPAS